VGSGLAEVALLAALTIVVLPCFFFTLLALLDRFERGLDPDEQAPPAFVVKTASVAAVVEALVEDESAGADVVALPVAVTMTQAPAAATG
jgi:hypothetical protein